MTNLLSLRPASAALGQERRDGYVLALSRWVQPFTRTVGRLIDRREIYLRRSIGGKMASGQPPFSEMGRNFTHWADECACKLFELRRRQAGAGWIFRFENETGK